MSGPEVALLILVLTLATALVARRLSTPAPVVLAAVGLLVGIGWHLVPWLPPLRLPPERVLLVFLPPLLTSAAYALPLRAVRQNAHAIALLAVGLVLATMAAAAATAHAALALPWAAALTFGAIVAPPDPVAATAVAERTGLAHRLVIILEGEGLINDAVAIVAYNVSVATVVAGGFRWAEAALELARAVPLGVGAGLAVGWALVRLRRGLDDVTLEAGMSLVAPFLTYELAERLGGSGVLAVVTFGFVLQRHATEIATPVVRLAARSVWGAVRFASTSLVFLLLGVLAGEVLGEGIAWAELAGGAAVAAAVIALRFAWMHVVPRLAHVVTRHAGGRAAPMPTGAERTVLGWAGMRGVVSLALALALPAIPGPAGAEVRHTMLVATIVVIVVTLVLQGATLLPLVQRLGAGDPARAERDERRARTRARRAGREAFAHGEAPPSLVSSAALDRAISRGRIGIARPERFPPRLRHPIEAALDAQRRVVERMRGSAHIGGTLAEQLATELDVDAMRVRGDSARITGALDG